VESVTKPHLLRLGAAGGGGISQPPNEPEGQPRAGGTARCGWSGSTKPSTRRVDCYVQARGSIRLHRKCYDIKCTEWPSCDMHPHKIFVGQLRRSRYRTSARMGAGRSLSGNKCVGH
jgi:hypothetical protein